MVPEFLSAGAGLLIGVLAVALVLGSRLRHERQTVAVLRTQRDEATKAQVQLAELRQYLATLRHDVRSILSPALLVADRLVSSEEATTRRAGEVMIRTVERAVARLTEAKFDQEGVEAQAGLKSDQA